MCGFPGVLMAKPARSTRVHTALIVNAAGVGLSQAKIYQILGA